MTDIAGESNVNRDAEIVSDGAGLGGELAEAVVDAWCSAVAFHYRNSGDRDGLLHDDTNHRGRSAGSDT